VKEEREKAAALNYERGIDAAPTIVAQGQGMMAQKIISLAQKNGVPVHEDRNLIEILSTIDLYEEIPSELYKAVAELLAFIYKMSGRL
jgi:flagellar biosynthesis protein